MDNDELEGFKPSKRWSVITGITLESVEDNMPTYVRTNSRGEEARVTLRGISWIEGKIPEKVVYEKDTLLHYEVSYVNRKTGGEKITRRGSVETVESIGRGEGQAYQLALITLLISDEESRFAQAG